VASRNSKTSRTCAETVDAKTSLWKAEENGEGIAGSNMDRDFSNNLDAAQEKPARSFAPLRREFFGACTGVRVDDSEEDPRSDESLHDYLTRESRLGALSNAPLRGRSQPNYFFQPA